MECIIAKIFGSEAQKEAAIELFMKTHGGRSFLHGHLFGDNVHEYLAPCIYEGEGEMLGMAFFKSLVKEHGKAFFEPIGKALQQHGIEDVQPAEPGPPLAAAQRAVGLRASGSSARRSPAATGSRSPGMDPRLAGARRVRAASSFARLPRGDQRDDGQAPAQAGRPPVPHGRAVAARAGHGRDAGDGLWAHRQKNEASTAAADILCQDLRRKLTGERPSDRYFRDVGKLADMILARRLRGARRRAARPRS